MLVRNSLPRGWWGAGTGCAEKLWIPHPRRCSRPGWMGPWAVWSSGRQPCLRQRNHRMAWVEKDHNDHRVSTPLLCAGLPTTRPGCPTSWAVYHISIYNIHLFFKETFPCHTWQPWSFISNLNFILASNLFDNDNYVLLNFCWRTNNCFLSLIILPSVISLP